SQSAAVERKTAENLSKKTNQEESPTHQESPQSQRLQQSSQKPFDTSTPVKPVEPLDEQMFLRQSRSSFDRQPDLTSVPRELARQGPANIPSWDVPYEPSQSEDAGPP